MARRAESTSAAPPARRDTSCRSAPPPPAACPARTRPGRVRCAPPPPVRGSGGRLLSMLLVRAPYTQDGRIPHALERQEMKAGVEPASDESDAQALVRRHVSRVPFALSRQSSYRTPSLATASGGHPFHSDTKV